MGSLKGMRRRVCKENEQFHFADFYRKWEEERERERESARERERERERWRRVRVYGEKAYNGIILGAIYIGS